MSNDNTQVTVEATNEQEKVDAQGTVEQQEDSKKEKTFTRADLAKMISAERNKWESEREKAESEAKKLAKMNADEKRHYQNEQREAELARREAEVTRKEMESEAKGMLSERNLPLELVSAIDLTDAESVRNSVSSVQKVWENAVQKAVENRIKGSAPIQKAQEAINTDPFSTIIQNYKK